jgi:hypothetical protein
VLTPPPTLAPTPLGPAFGLTEDNAQLLYPPQARGRAIAAGLQAARARLTALQPGYVRLLVDWAALQPSAAAPPAVEGAVDGCARATAPCAGYRGIAAELAAIADQQRVARASGQTFPVVLVVFGVPAWAARAPGGCETSATQPFSRPITPAGLAGYRALIRALLSLGAREGVALSLWSPWNEPNNPQFLSPQREACSTGSPSLAPGVYAQLAQAMSDELTADGAEHRLLLGELAGYETSSPHDTSVAEFVDRLPHSIVCLSGDWAIHAYASYGATASAGDPVAALEAALARRGACGARARVWVTEAGAGAPPAGQQRVVGARNERAGCLSLASQLHRWSADPRVEAILQYSFRDDPAFPVGLLSADLSRVRADYQLWLLYARARARGQPPPPAARLCA